MASTTPRHARKPAERSRWHPSYARPVGVAPPRTDGSPTRRPRAHSAVRAMRPGWQPRAGEMRAGRVLMIMVAGLALAALVNADAMVARAERKPFGTGRDHSLAIWEPIRSVSHVLQLHRLRSLADLFSPEDDSPRASTPAPASSPTSSPPSATPAALAAVRPTLRTPTPTDRLRLLIAGDSVARDFGESLVSYANATGLISPTLHYQIATGLARPDFFDWPAALARDVEGTPDVALVMFGANDAQGMELPDGTDLQRTSDPRWQAEYARRVGAVMDQLHAENRLVLWVGQPVMRDAAFSSRMDLLDEIYRSEAARRPWVEFFDSRSLFSDAAGRYATYLPDDHGVPQNVRQPDGIHLSRAGADRLARAVLAVIEHEAKVPGAP